MNVGQTPATATTVVYLNDLVAASKGRVYVVDPLGNLTIPDNQAISRNSTSTLAPSSGYLSPTNPVAMSFLDQQVFFVSGIAQAAVLSTNAITSTSTFAMGILTVSTTPSSQAVPTFCTLAQPWRGRLCLAGDINNPQNFYMSRLGQPTDWNYSANDPAAAVAGNLSESGQIGEPITCMIPFNDDLMIISTTNGIWLIEGDPAQNGSIVLLVRGLGIIGPYAWCVDPTGTVYFVTQAGIYSVVPIWAVYRPPQLISGNEYSYFFETLDPSVTSVVLQWDATNKYLRLYATSVAGGEQHLVFDSRNAGYWPVQYDPKWGPTAAANYVSGIGSNSQLVVLGGLDGVLREESISNFPNPASSDLSAYMQYSPFRMDPTDQVLLQRMEVQFGELPNSVSSAPNATFAGTVFVISGPTAADVSDFAYPLVSTSTYGGNFQTYVSAFSTDRRQVVMYPRLAGEWFSVGISSNAGQYFSIEDIRLAGIPYGLNRVAR
jgi:hypothetical protein